MDVEHGAMPLDVLRFLRDAFLLGWAATAVFCAVAATAVSIWAGVRWWVGLLVGLVGLYLGVVLLLAVGGVRAADRRRESRSDRAAGADLLARWGGGPPVTASVTAPTPTPTPGATPVPPVVPEPGVRRRVRQAWRWWTRTPPRRADVAAAVAAVVVAAGLVVATQVTWVTVSAAGHGVTGLGPFAVQLGLFLVLSAVAALVCAVGVLRWRSGWWPVLLAWFGTWWAFVALEAMRAQGALAVANRLLRREVRGRLGYDARPELGLGAGWTLVFWLAVAMSALAVVLLGLQGRGAPHYRLPAKT